MRYRGTSLARLHFVLVIIVILLLMYGVMQVFERYSTAGRELGTALLSKQLSEQLALVHGQWLAEHYPDRVWSALAPGGYFLMTSSGWPTDWVAPHTDSGQQVACERLWRALLGHSQDAKVVPVYDGCRFQYENQRVDYIFTGGNVMVY